MKPVFGIIRTSTLNRIVRILEFMDDGQPFVSACDMWNTLGIPAPDRYYARHMLQRTMRYLEKQGFIMRTQLRRTSVTNNSGRGRKEFLYRITQAGHDALRILRKYL